VKPSEFIRKRIEYRFIGPKYAVDISVPNKEWVNEILTFLDQEAERQKAIEETICNHIDDLETKIGKIKACYNCARDEVK
jgi:hypothetical protein